MLEFEEYKQKLNALKPTLDGLRDALRLEAAERRSRSWRGSRRRTASGTMSRIRSVCRSA